MVKPKRNLFALLGWVVWKLLSLFGVKVAKDKLSQDRPRGGRRQRA
ncbi:hypothetical protein [Nocardioides plantarum]|uniref:Uncharacterized protein n=1 Tax=Nocardioides plantarum TaxID=29299 RepID=A0ABV5KEY8_9ACTN|nr:hypothetical protein [Nocardioides plantarum]